jgi:hypothetical protein
MDLLVDTDAQLCLTCIDRVRIMTDDERMSTAKS